MINLHHCTFTKYFLELNRIFDFQCWFSSLNIVEKVCCPKVDYLNSEEKFLNKFTITMWCLSWFDILICQKKRSEFRVLEMYNFARCPNFTPILPGVLPNPKASYGPRIVFYERLSPLGEKHSIQLVAWKMDVVELPPWITSSSSMAALLCLGCWMLSNFLPSTRQRLYQRHNGA